MKERSRVLIAGCGYVGSAAAAQLRELGHHVFGARRDPSALPDGVEPIAIDLLRDDLGALPADLDAVVWAVSPSPDEAGYRNAYVDAPRRLLAFLRERGDAIARAVLVGSTSVWHRDDGAFVDERTKPTPADFRGRAVLDGEAVFADSPFRSVALRLGGIYGPGRTWLIERVRGGEAAPPAAAVYGNRIWRDDAAKAIVHVLQLLEPDPVYVVVDNHPADLRRVYAALAERLGVDLPAPTSTFAGRGGSKRCCNARLCATGWHPDVPDFHSGYARLLHDA